MRETVARLEGKACAADGAVRADARTDGVRFGVEAIDARLPGGRLAPGLHEIAGLGRDREHATAPARLAAHLLGRGKGPVLWVVERHDLFAPGLSGCGLSPDRLIVAEAGREALATVEEGARTRGLAGVVGEWSGRLELTASRRIQLAAEASGVPVFVLRRQRVGARPGTVSALDAPNAAATRWRIACLPSMPADPIEAGAFSLSVGGALWRLDMIRARGAAPASWMVEAFDEAGRLAVVPASRDRPAAASGGVRGRDGDRGWAAGDLVA